MAVLEGRLCTEQGVCLSILPLCPYYLDQCPVCCWFSNNICSMSKSSGVLQRDTTTMLKLTSDLFKQSDTHLLAQIYEMKI